MINRQSAALVLTSIALLAAGPVRAAEQQICAVQRDVPPAQVLQQLSAQLGQDETVSSASEQDLVSGFLKVAGADPGLIRDLAALIVAGRPELVEPLREHIEAACPELASTIMPAVEDAANNPSPEQLEALIKPAAGGDDPPAPDNGGEDDPFDPILNDPANPGSPS